MVDINDIWEDEEDTRAQTQRPSFGIKRSVRTVDDLVKECREAVVKHMIKVAAGEHDYAYSEDFIDEAIFAVLFCTRVPVEELAERAGMWMDGK